MFEFKRLKQFLGFRFDIKRNLQEQFSELAGLLFSDREENAGEIFQQAFLSLVYPLLTRDGKLNEDCKTVFRSLLEEYFNQQTAEKHIAQLTKIELLTPDSAIEIIKKEMPDKNLRIAEFLVVLAVALGCRNEDTAFARKTALGLGMNSDEFSAFLRQIIEAEHKKQRLLNSSRGILAALVIIAIFFLTAKYLQSVIFGLLLACLLLPLEKFYESRIASGKGFIFWTLKILSAPLLPLKKIAAIISKKSDLVSTKSSAKIQRQHIIRQSVALCCFTALVIVIAVLFGISKLTGHYMKSVQHSIRSWEHEQIQEMKSGSSADVVINRIKENFESLPLIQHGLDYLKKIINSPQIRNQIIQNMLRRSGGIINFTGTVIGGIVSFFCDLLLTIFFSLLFLLKFAEFSNSGTEKRSGSEYIVRMFFSGIWLPGADESVIQETCKIINGILFRFRTWLKGYLTLILVDSTFYTTCFFFLGVPFFLPLGLIAGCGIVLPYLGPLISCTLTLLVCIAAGGVNAEILLLVIISYLIYNGIIEQFILYPAVIGESLGLSTLETIIVVLLGAILAGIPGMIFALPTASIAKYLIPLIYHGFSINSRISVKRELSQ